MIISNIHQIFAGLVDVLFPRRCIICGNLPQKEQKHPICATCLSKMTFDKSPLCILCGSSFPVDEGSNHYCGDCIISRPPFSIARALGKYNSVMLDAIHQFKYQGKVIVGEIMGNCMADFKYDTLNINDYSLIIPVPLHTKKLKARGFNQSLILARQIAKKFSIPLDFTTLRRQINTEPQIGLGKSQRIKNVKRAFEVTNKRKIEGHKIILVDDVYTTGSTVKECSRVLLDNKAAEVAVITLARA